MSRGTRVVLTVSLLLVLLSGSAWAQSTIWSEGFETDGQSSRYTASQPFNDGSNDHWNRTDGTDISASYTGFTGSFFWAGEDVDDNGGNGNAEQTILFSDVNTSVYTGLEFSGQFTATENGHDALDYVIIEYSNDSGSNWNTLMEFAYQDNGDDFNEPFGQDTNGDGSADVILGAAATTLTANLPDAASTRIRIRVSLTSASEDFGFDEFTITGTAAAGLAAGWDDDPDDVAGQDVLDVGDSHTLNWTVNNASGGTWTTTLFTKRLDNDATVATDNTVAADASTHSWTVPSISYGGQVYLQLSVNDGSDTETSNSDPFYIDEASPSGVAWTTNPSGTIDGNSNNNLVWTSSDDIVVANHTLEYSFDDFSSSTTFATIGGDETSYTWTAPNVDEGSVKLRVTATDSVGNQTSATTAAFEIQSVVVTTLLEESFETDGAGSRYTVEDEFYTDNDDYWGRVQAGDTDISYTGLDGSYMYAGEDIDSGAGDAEKILQFDPFSTVAYGEVTFFADFGTKEANGIDNSDFVDVQYSTNGSDWTTFMQFRNDGTGFNTRFYYDADMDGTGEGAPDEPILTEALTTYSATIPGGAANLHIRLVVSIGSDNETFAFDNIRVETGSEPTFTLTDMQWALIGIPVVLDDANDGIPTTLFNDDFGMAYGDGNWIVSRYNMTTNDYDRFTGSGQDGGLPQLMSPGYGYWMIYDSEDATNDIDVDINLNSGEPLNDIVLDDAMPANDGTNDGKQMFANPFNGTYDVSQMTFTDNNYTWAQAAGGANDQGLNDNIYTWNGASSSYVPEDPDVAELDAWEGFWLIRTATGSAIDVTFPVGGVTSSIDDVSELDEEGDWSVLVRVDGVNAPQADPSNRFGVKAGARDGYDAQDAFDLTPQAGSYVRLYFPRQEWPNHPGDYAFDFRRTPVDDRAIWTATLEMVGVTGESFRISWPEIAELDETLDVALYEDRGTTGNGFLADLRETGELIVTAENDSDVRRYQFVVTRGEGSATTAVAEGNAGLPTEFGIEAAYPNPFNAEIRVRYGLPETGNVDGAVYDLLGRRVATLVQGTKAAGYHEFTWHAAEVASGVYFIRLQAAGDQQLRKVVLLR